MLDACGGCGGVGNKATPKLLELDRYPELIIIMIQLRLT